VTISTQDSIPTWLTNGLVAYYPFNGNANDESGNGNNGTVNGATLTRDRLGNGSKAYSFDGVNDFINCGIFNLNSNQISINLWINESAVSSNRNVIISKYDGVSYPGDNSISRTFSLIRHDASYQNRFHAQISFDGINTFESFSSEFGVPQIWRMITISYDGNLLKWYFNGVFHSQVQINSLSNLFSSNTPIYVGCFSDGNSPESALGFFNGQIDDIRIYNRALSQSEITYLATH
jgi:hypothetical protein